MTVRREEATRGGAGDVQEATGDAATGSGRGGGEGEAETVQRARDRSTGGVRLGGAPRQLQLGFPQITSSTNSCCARATAET